jgi:Peptidase inhibitor family I36
MLGSTISARTKIIAGAMAAAGALAVMPAAWAAPVPLSQAPCPDRKICFYEASNFGLRVESHYQEEQGCINLGYLSNRTTSIANKTYLDWDVYDSANCTSSSRMALVYARTANNNIGSANNDRITSIRRRA